MTFVLCPFVISSCKNTAAEHPQIYKHRYVVKNVLSSYVLWLKMTSIYNIYMVLKLYYFHQ